MTLHLVAGLPCAGKSTYALALGARTGGVVFSLDRWLITLYGRYSIASIGYDEHVRRVLACRELIWEAASELLHRSADVILDDGFFLRENRMRAIAMARAAGAMATIHFVDTPEREIRSRLAERNAHLPPHNFHIDPKLLDTFVRMFELPSEDEGARVIVVS